MAKGSKTDVQLEECLRDHSFLALETVECSVNTGNTIVQVGFIPKFQSRHNKKITHLVSLTLPRKSCQDRSLRRSPFIGNDPLAEITTAIGALASTTLL